MTRPRLVTASEAGVELTLASDTPATADTAARTIEGIVVPFGPGGRTSGGLLTFAPGSVRVPKDPGRVKLLLEHDQRHAVGYGVEFAERPEGLWGKFHVPEGDPDGDRVLAQAANRVRDAFSVGVLLDAAVEANLMRNTDRTKPVKGSGDLRETSMVAVPAFDDARVSAVAASGASRLVVSAWADVNPTPETEGSTMTEATQATEATTASTEATTEATAEPTTASTSTTTAAETTTASGPAVVPAVGGNALTVAGEPSTYTFSGEAGAHSLVRDAYLARMDGDRDAADRIRKFNAEIAGGNPASMLALAAVETTTTAPNIVEQFHRPDLMRAMIDRARPILSRINIVPISSANPYAIPTVGEFDGVGDHTEGTAHVAEGDLMFGGDTITPRAVSGAYRISRELIDSSNPLLDRVALRKMMKDYRRHTELKAWTAFTTGLAPTLSIDTVAEFDTALDDFVNDDDETADFALTSKSYLATLKADTDSTGRPHLARYAPSNASGTLSRSRVGVVAEFGDTDLVRASTVTADQAALIREAGVHAAESRVQQFSFSEVEGPGVVKLALWAYFAAARLEDTDVQLVTSAAV